MQPTCAQRQLRDSTYSAGPRTVISDTRAVFVLFAIALLLSVLALGTTQKPAHACSITLSHPHSLPVEVFGESEDLEDMNATSGPVKKYAAEYFEGKQPDNLDRVDIVGVHRTTTVQKDENSAVEVYDGIWGEVDLQNTDPIVTQVDPGWSQLPIGMRCPSALAFVPNVGESSWTLVTSPARSTVTVGQHPFGGGYFAGTASLDEMYATEFTRLFGEPALTDAGVYADRLAEVKALVKAWTAGRRAPMTAPAIDMTDGFDMVASTALGLAVAGTVAVTSWRRKRTL